MQGKAFYVAALAVLSASVIAFATVAFVAAQSSSSSSSCTGPASRYTMDGRIR